MKTLGLGVKFGSQLCPVVTVIWGNVPLSIKKDTLNISPELVKRGTGTVSKTLRAGAAAVIEWVISVQLWPPRSPWPVVGSHGKTSLYRGPTRP